MTNRAFAYNPSQQEISGCTQVGDLAIGTPITGFTDSPQFWAGPNEELGYVICVPVPDNTQPTEIPGVTASVGFYRSSELTDESFIHITNVATNSSFTGVTECLDELDTLGYWTSYEAPTPPVNPLPPLTDVLLYLKYEDAVVDMSLNQFIPILQFDPFDFSTDYSPKVGFNKGVRLLEIEGQKFTFQEDVPVYESSIFTWVNSQSNLSDVRPIIELINGTAGASIEFINSELILRKGGNIVITVPGFSGNTWYHVGYTSSWDSNTEIETFKLYANGVEVGTYDISNVNFMNQLSFEFLVAKNGDKGAINGLYDETIEFNTVLTQEQITNLYERTTPAY